MDNIGDFSSYIEALCRAGDSLYTINLNATNLNANIRDYGDVVSRFSRYERRDEPLRNYEISEGVVWHPCTYGGCNPSANGEYLVTLKDIDVAHIREFKNGKWLSSVKVVAWANLPAVYRWR